MFHHHFPVVQPVFRLVFRRLILGWEELLCCPEVLRDHPWKNLVDKIQGGTHGGLPQARWLIFAGKSYEKFVYVKL